MDSDTNSPIDPAKPDWIDWIKQQTEDPSSLLNDQLAAEFAEVMMRVGGEAGEGSLDSSIIESLRSLVFDKLTSGQIAEHSRRRFTRAKDAFLSATAGFGATGNQVIDDEIAKLKQKVMDNIRAQEVGVRLLIAMAKGRAYTLEEVISAVTTPQ